LSLCSLHVQQSINSQWCVADCVIYSASSSVNVVGTSHLWQSSIASYQTRIAISAYTPFAFDAPVRGGGSRRNIGTPFGMEKLEWCGYFIVQKI